MAEHCPLMSRIVPADAADEAAYLLRYFALDISRRMRTGALGEAAAATATAALHTAEILSPTDAPWAKAEGVTI